MATAFLRIDADAERIPAVNALLVGHGIKVYELTPAQESLEEAFLRLTKDGDTDPRMNRDPTVPTLSAFRIASRRL